MSYSYFKNRLSSQCERVFYILQEAQIEHPERDLSDLGENLAETHHELFLSRVFAAIGLLAVVNSLKKIEQSVDRDRALLDSNGSISWNYDRVINFAEQVVDKEISIFEAAQKAYVNAKNN